MLINNSHICHDTKILSFFKLSALTFCSSHYEPEIKHSKKISSKILKSLEVLEKNFMHYLRVVIILFNKDFYKSAFINYSFGKIVFCFSDAFHFIFIYFETFICVIVVYYYLFCQFIKTV